MKDKSVRDFILCEFPIADPQSPAVELIAMILLQSKKSLTKEWEAYAGGLTDQEIQVRWQRAKWSILNAAAALNNYLHQSDPKNKKLVDDQRKSIDYLPRKNNKNARLANFAQRLPWIDADHDLAEQQERVKSNFTFAKGESRLQFTKMMATAIEHAGLTMKRETFCALIAEILTEAGRPIDSNTIAEWIVKNKVLRDFIGARLRPTQSK